MKIIEIIIELKKEITAKRINHLEKINAPSILIQKAKEKLDMMEKLNDTKVDGLQQKYKNLKQVEPISYRIFNSKTRDFKNGINDTIVIEFELADEIYYYDWYENKFGKRIEMTIQKYI